MSGSWRLIEGDCRASLAWLDAGSVQTCVTSPPYFGLRDYGTGAWEGGDPACEHRMETKHQQQGATSARVGRANIEAQRNGNFRDECGQCGARRVDRQIGLEPTPDEFVAALVAVFRDVRRVLRDDGTVWLNLGDSYCGAGYANRDLERNGSPTREDGGKGQHGSTALPGVKSKDLIGIPWMVAFALRADGWYLRSDIIWAKPNPMPESVTDRPTKAHEYLFLLSKSARYFYDADAVREPLVREWGPNNGGTLAGGSEHTLRTGQPTGHVRQAAPVLPDPRGANKRTVWTVATQPFPGAHFATFPPKLIEPCILAGSAPGDVVLDPFAGSGTTGMVALRHGRAFVGCELNADYVRLARDRIIADSPLLNSFAEEAA